MRNCNGCVQCFYLNNDAGLVWSDVVPIYCSLPTSGSEPAHCRIQSWRRPHTLIRQTGSATYKRIWHLIRWRVRVSYRRCYGFSLKPTWTPTGQQQQRLMTGTAQRCSVVYSGERVPKGRLRWVNLKASRVKADINIISLNTDSYSYDGILVVCWYNLFVTLSAQILLRVKLTLILL